VSIRGLIWIVVNVVVRQGTGPRTVGKPFGVGVLIRSGPFYVAPSSNRILDATFAYVPFLRVASWNGHEGIFDNTCTGRGSSRRRPVLPRPQLILDAMPRPKSADESKRKHAKDKNAEPTVERIAGSSRLLGFMAGRHGMSITGEGGLIVSQERRTGVSVLTGEV
jgi:hypothetical protein